MISMLYIHVQSLHKACSLVVLGQQRVRAARHEDNSSINVAFVSLLWM